MPVMMFRANVKSEHVAEVEAAAKTVFSALQDIQPQPQSMHCAAYKLSDGETFVIMLELAEGTENPLNSVPAYRQFLQSLKAWLVEPASQEQLTVVGSYNRN